MTSWVYFISVQGEEKRVEIVNEKSIGHELVFGDYSSCICFYLKFIIIKKSKYRNFIHKK